MTINDIAVELKRLAAEVGGNHYTNKEIEKQLIQCAKELDNININMSITLNQCINDFDFNYTGVSDQHRRLHLRQQNIKELAERSERGEI